MNYLIIGKDARYEYLRSLLNQAGFHEETPADLLILGARDSMESHLDHLRTGAYILGGIDTDARIAAVGMNRLNIRDEFRKKNSRATAEGALCLAISETEIALLNAPILVLGFGFLGKETAKLFHSFGCNVTICSKETSELSDARTMGFKTIALKQLSALPYSVILNTIPHGVLSSALFATAPYRSILIELASIPCCKCAAKTIKTIDARGLPGRYTPLSAASYLMDEIINWKEGKQTIWNDLPKKT